MSENMDHTEHNFDDMLNFDPLATAEKITGASYKEDEGTFRAGLALMMRHTAEKRDELMVRQDSYMGMSMDEFIKIVEAQGFEKVFERDFQGDCEDRMETQYVFWKNGLLLHAETFTMSGKTVVNDATMYFNFEEQGGCHLRRSLPLSGYLNAHAYDEESRYICVGNIDVREAFVHYLNKIESMSNVLPCWIEQPFLWLLNYQQKSAEDNDFEAITAEVIAAMPEKVRAAITVEEN